MKKKEEDVFLSVIVPVYNEESTISEFQKSLRQLKGKCEIIFVDGGSSDRTVELIEPEYKVLVSGKGRGAQMNCGARHSRGEVLFFLHCDSELPKGAFDQIQEVMRRCRMGFFGITFASRSPEMKCCGFLSNSRAKRRKIIFGDQGIFLERKLFFAAGGFPELPIMEDYMFSLTIRKMKVPVGMTGKRILTSDRRFGRTPWKRLRTMLLMHLLRMMFRCGVPIEKIADIYKDIR